MIDEALKPWLI